MFDFLKLKRGCRQGDPISPYIFILCAEILCKMIWKNEKVKGITINGKEFRLSQYADNTQIFLMVQRTQAVVTLIKPGVLI